MPALNLLEAIELHLPNGFSIQGQLGTGGTSSVYLARHGTTGERLVVKVMRAGSVTDQSADRFLREMQVLQKLKHPRIIPILQPGEANGALFFTMPYIEGETLRARLKTRAPLMVREALTITRDVAAALGHAHGAGVVHRDVKPENILLSADGAYLMDFGFANAPGVTSHGDAAREAQFIVGTPDYMSPEQVTGKHSVDGRSDFYSLGCVLYEMLTAQLPFAASSQRAAMLRRLSEPAPDVRSVRPDVPDDVALLVRHALDPHPGGRFATAGFMRVAIDAATERLDQPSAAAS